MARINGFKKKRTRQISQLVTYLLFAMITECMCVNRIFSVDMTSRATLRKHRTCYVLRHEIYKLTRRVIIVRWESWRVAKTGNKRPITPVERFVVSIHYISNRYTTVANSHRGYMTYEDIFSATHHNSRYINMCPDLFDRYACLNTNDLNLLSIIMFTESHDGLDDVSEKVLERYMETGHVSGHLNILLIPPIKRRFVFCTYSVWNDIRIVKHNWCRHK